MHHATLTVATRNTKSLFTATADSADHIHHLIDEVRDWIKHSPHHSLIVTITWRHGAVHSFIVERA